MFDRFTRLVGWMGLVGALGAAVAVAQGQTPPDQPFAIPRDRAGWEAQRPEIGTRLGGTLADPAWRYSARTGVPARLKSHPDVIAEAIQAMPDRPANPIVSGQFLRRARSVGAGRQPLVVLVVDPCGPDDLVIRPGWDGRPPALVLVEMGFAVLIFDHSQLASPFGFLDPLRAALDVVLLRPEIDPTRVAVLGLGQTGMTALRLMATDSRVTCGIVAIESRAAQTFQVAGAGAATATVTTHFEELAALCAPRPLNLMVGEPLPLPPATRSVGRLLERAMLGTYKVYGKDGADRSFTLFGEFGDQTSVSTRLQWMAGLEWLDKHFRPQGPTPLGSTPEPEPTFDPLDKTVLNLTEHGIAGWSSEMSGRDSTWTWRDGVVVCQPRAHEYGWLRAPVEVSDYLLQVEWQVPEHGNAGIFMRAQPVDWILPPTEENKLRVSSLGLTWPSRTGLELQTQDDPDHADRYSTGSIYRHAAPAANPTHSPHQWNRSTVRARGTRIEVWNNGQQVLDADLARCTDTLPNPPLQGYIGLQNHGAPAEYRNIRLKRL